MAASYEKRRFLRISFLEKEEDIDIKIRSVSNRKFLFQTDFICFKAIFCR